MDITQWLKDTAAAGQPKQPTPIARSPTALGAPKSEGYLDPVVHTPKRRLPTRKRSGGSSSILAPANSPSDRPARQPKKATRDDVVLSVTSETRSHQSVSSGADSASDSENTEPYRRRKRHKTRADKYDVKPKRSRNAKEHAGHRDRKGKRKEKKGTKEKKKVIKGKTAAAVVQNFSAPNVQTERLTHAPNIGLFNRGRASSAFRGRGIPDLVFSEMNFLQNRKGVHDAGNPVEGARAGRSMGKVRQSEEEISAYFVPTRLPLQKKETNRLPRERLPVRASKQRSRTDSHRRQILEANHGRHSIEPCAASARSAPATYFTWSTSVVSGVRPEVGSLAGQLRRSLTQNPSHTSARISDVPSHDPRSLLSHEDPKLIRGDGNDQHLAHAADRRQDRDCVVQWAKAQDHQSQKHPRQRITDTVVPRSRMEPKRTIQESTESLPMPSSPPKFVEKRSAPMAPPDSVGEEPAPHESALSSEPADQILQSSTPLDDLLQDCEAAILAQSPEGLVNAVDDVQPVLPHDHDEEDDEEYIAKHTEGPASREDVRRAWRNRHDEEPGHFQLARQPYFPPVDHVAAQHFFVQSNLADEDYLQMDGQYIAQQSDEHDVHVDTEERFKFAGEDGKPLMTFEPPYDAQGYGIEPVEEDDFDGFWRPNVLY